MEPKIMHPSEQKARTMIAQRTTFDLVADFESTDKQTTLREIFIVRGWIMDELERRDPEAFENWLLSSESSPREFYIGEA